MHIWIGRYEECKGVEQAKAIITCKKLILKEGHIKTYRLGGFFSWFSWFSCLLCVFFHFSLDMRPDKGAPWPPDSCRQALDRQTDLRKYTGVTFETARRGASTGTTAWV